MSKKIQNLELEALRNFAATDSLSNDFLIFDNSTAETGQHFLFGAMEHAVKVDVVIIILCHRGDLTVQLGYAQHKCSASSCLIIMSGKVFQILEYSDDLRMDAICIRDSFFESHSHHHKTIDLRNAFTEQPCRTIPAEQMKELRWVLSGVKESMRRKDNPYRRDIVMSYVNILFYNACMLYTTPVTSKEITHSEEIFNRFIRDVELYFRKERSVSFYADKACLTPKYFSAVIHDLTGQHATEWINTYTILEAKALLKTTTKSVQEIAYDMNFANASHFSQYFRRQTGMSPSAYRNSRPHAPNPTAKREKRK